MGINGRLKGNAQERKVAKAFSKWWGTEFTRTPMSGGFATKTFREDWNAVGDLVTPDTTFPFCVESKKVEGWHLEQLLTSPSCLWYSWWKQTLDETPDTKWPLLVFTRNRQPLFYAIKREHNRGIPGVILTLHLDDTLIDIGLASDLFSTPPDLWK